eukprot:8189126-Prorocentrum_lima.AAC.1
MRPQYRIASPPPPLPRRPFSPPSMHATSEPGHPSRPRPSKLRARAPVNAAPTGQGNGARWEVVVDGGSCAMT